MKDFATPKKETMSSNSRFHLDNKKSGRDPGFLGTSLAGSIPSRVSKLLLFLFVVFAVSVIE